MTILEQCKEVFQNARKSVFEGVALLYEISEKRLWEGTYSGFGEYVEAELQLHPTQASRYLKAYEHFVLKGKQDLAQLNQINPERLYTAMALSMPVEQQLTRAAMWSVRQIKDELASNEHGDCQHLETIHLCVKCHKRL